MTEKSHLQAPALTVSIIIPCYNCVEFIAETVNCALEHDYENKEIIVIDAGSTDGSSEILQQYGDRIKIVKSSPEGVSAARNRGIRAASGSYFQFLDADDLILPGKLQQNVRLLQETGADVVMADFFILRNGQRIRSLKDRRREQFDSTEEFVMYAFPVVGRCLYKANLVRKVGGFDNFKRGEDHLFHFTLLAADATFVYADKRQFLYRDHETGGRLTSASVLKRAPYEVKEKNSMIEAMLKKCGRLDEISRKALSFNSYMSAMRFYSLGDRKVGDDYLRESKRYWSPPVLKGPRFFVILNKMLGCRYAAIVSKSSLFAQLGGLIRGLKAKPASNS